MSRSSMIRSVASSIVLSFFAAGCAALEPDEPSAMEGTPTSTSTQAVCTYPTTVTFGVADSFSLITPDPIPYSPALPEFVTYLNGLGVTTANMKTFDALTPNRHMVATLRHGLRSCFAGATGLSLCFRARAHADVPTNDSVSIYNTDFGVYSFPVVYSASIAPTLIGAWPAGTTATLCVNLTSQMVGGLIGDMLQFRVQDDSAVDFIAMTLY